MKNLFSIKGGILAAVILALVLASALVVLAIVREVRSNNDNTEAFNILKSSIEQDRSAIYSKLDSIAALTNEAMTTLSYLELNTFAQSQTGKKYEKQAAEIVAASNDVRNARFQKLREQFWNRYSHGYYTNFPDR